MSSGAAEYLKTAGGVLHFARVGLHVAPRGNDGVTVMCAPTVFSDLGGQVNPEAPGFLAWQRAAEAGVRWGADLAGVTSMAVQVRTIVGTYVDTTERAIAGAAAWALWDAVGFDVTQAIRDQLDQFVLAEVPLARV